MKVALILSAIAGASAFAPASQSTRLSSSLAATAELDGMRGTGIESPKVVRWIVQETRIGSTFTLWLTMMLFLC